MLLEQEWPVGVRRVPSPHCDCRPDDETPTLLVVHNISLSLGGFGGPRIDALFTEAIDPQTYLFFAKIAHLRTSAHCLIYHDGEIVQYVPFDKRTWHVGASQYQGRERCNDPSIGIELGGTNTLTYTNVQYQQLAAVTWTLIDRYSNIVNNMTSHYDIAPDRKVDPGPVFDWARLHVLVSKETT